MSVPPAGTTAADRRTGPRPSRPRRMRRFESVCDCKSHRVVSSLAISVCNKIGK